MLGPLCNQAVYLETDPKTPYYSFRVVKMI